MSRIKLTTAHRFTSLSAGDSFQGYPIIETTPGAPDVILELPDTLSADEIDQQVRKWQSQGLVLEHGEDGLWATEKSGWHAMGTIHHGVLPEWAPGDTFSLIGVDDATQRRGGWGAQVLIGHCDTGVDGTHPWFQGKSLEGDIQGDSAGHGTFCAGLMVGAQGIASDAALFTLNVLPGGSGTESSVAGGIRKCAERGAHCMNLSLGGGSSTIIDNAVRYAQQLGCIVVSAAGNTANAPIGSPARVSDVVVLAVSRDREYASFTSGTNWDTPNRTAAPGVQIVSAAPHGSTAQGDGTSFAAPHITAVVALLLASGLHRQEVLDYLWAHRTDDPDHLGAHLAEDFGSDGADQPPVDQAGIRRLAEQVLAKLDHARFVVRAQDDDAAWSVVGEACDPWAGELAMIIEATAPSSTPAPPPPPPPSTLTFVPPLQVSGPYGRTKWLAGSLGADIFVRGHTPFYAPCDGTIAEVVGGDGLHAGAEVILVAAGNAWSFRFRHVMASVKQGAKVKQGQELGVVYDESLKLLGNTPSWFPAPDQYQHLDLSVDQGTDRFDPTGGSGGNLSAADWLQGVGYAGQVVARTPGPPDAQHPFESYEALSQAHGEQRRDRSAEPPPQDEPDQERANRSKRRH